MSRDRTERVLLVCDEAYLMIDPNVPQSLVFLRNVEKRARKYEAGLIIISHSVVDFLVPEVKMYGQALLDISCIKLMMVTDGKNLAEIKELYNLTEAEQELLESKKEDTPCSSLAQNGCISTLRSCLQVCLHGQSGRKIIPHIM